MEKTFKEELAKTKAQIERKHARLEKANPILLGITLVLFVVNFVLSFFEIPQELKTTLMVIIFIPPILQLHIAEWTSGYFAGQQIALIQAMEAVDKFSNKEES